MREARVSDREREKVDAAGAAAVSSAFVVMLMSFPAEAAVCGLRDVPPKELSLLAGM